MTSQLPIGGVVHTYQKYDPQRFPSPTQPPPDLVSPAFEHMLAFGGLRELTDEELARAVRLDPSQIAGLGPSLDSLIARLLERKQKILAKYETDTVQDRAGTVVRTVAQGIQPPPALRDRFQKAVTQEQIYDLERLWYAAKNERSPFARGLVQLMERLGDKYQIDILAGKYQFTGRVQMTIPQALEIKRELEEIDRLRVLVRSRERVSTQGAAAEGIVTAGATTQRDAAERAAANSDTANGPAAEGNDSDCQSAQGDNAARKASQRKATGGDIADGNNASGVSAPFTPGVIRAQCNRPKWQTPDVASGLAAEALNGEG